MRRVLSFYRNTTPLSFKGSRGAFRSLVPTCPPPPISPRGSGDECGASADARLVAAAIRELGRELGPKLDRIAELLQPAAPEVKTAVSGSHPVSSVGMFLPDNDGRPKACRIAWGSRDLQPTTQTLTALVHTTCGPERRVFEKSNILGKAAAAAREFHFKPKIEEKRHRS